ncbi:MAG TPA: PIG-L family deacetylase [Longimicrobiaceae bacterium]|nr:PIG-L family deacetylase [Longimicrobiaceae bacterium]
MKRSRIAPLALAAALVLAGGPVPAPAQQGRYDGAAALGFDLRGLASTKRVLMIGAHPDDETTQVLSTLALGRGAEVAYLSLTRGEGGQNGIGLELGEGLGLLRTEELLAARGVDGAHQFFSRAYDFGFSKTSAESFRHWPRDTVLADVVATIRSFRPDVVIAVFTGTPADGHGQHQVSGILAREAFDAAGDPARFPAQVAAGLRPFTPRKLYQAYWRSAPDAQVQLSTGAYDPLIGLSYYQVAMESRSQHRSQDMGRILTPGPQTSALGLLKVHGAPIAAPGLFAGVDTTLAARLSSSGVKNARAAALLLDFQRTATSAASEFDPLSPAGLVPDLVSALRALGRADSALAGDTVADLRFYLQNRRERAEDALMRASGLVLDAVSDDETVTPGESFTLTLSLWNGGSEAVTPQRLEPRLPDGWSAEPLDPLPASLAPDEMITRRFRVRVPAPADLTRPYFLLRPRDGDLYRWPAGVRVGVPFEPAQVRAASRVVIDGVPVDASRDADFRTVDKWRGEIRRPVRVVPAVSVLLDPQLAVVPIGTSAAGQPLRFAVHLRSDAPTGVSGTLRLRLPRGWSAQPDSLPIRFTRPGEERVAEFTLRPPPSLTAGEDSVGAVFVTADGRRFDQGYTLVDYPHIQPRALYRPAESRLRAFEVHVAPGLRVGYVAGAGDDTEEALRQMGVQVEALSATDLAEGDLSRFEAIVTGIRAYEVRPDLVAHNDRLLGYVRNGGTLVVEYNKYEYTRPGIAPYPVTMARPHDRVTDENAAVTLLHPENPLLSWPNRIGPADFQGWIQDRGLYFLHTWDEHFTPLLEMADPGEAPLRGGLLVAKYGKGNYVYTGLALFRQLPAGVPGAYRILANLVSLGAAK